MWPPTSVSRYLWGYAPGACRWRMQVYQVLVELIEDPGAAIRMQRSQGLMKQAVWMMHTRRVELTICPFL